MGRQFIVVRASPDWRSFDVELSRSFCRRVGLPETTIVDFVDLWDRTLRVRYRDFRFCAKEIAGSTLAAVANAQVVSHENFRAMSLEADDRIAFIDDDDWYAPNLFDLATNDHGARWGSIRLGQLFSPNPEPGLDGLLTVREIDTVIYTNNYLVSGRALSDLGYASLFEHQDAQKAQDEGLYRPLASERYMSCANKTPASAVSAHYLLSLKDFRSDPEREFRRYVDRLNATGLPPPATWMREPFEQFKALMNETASRG